MEVRPIAKFRRKFDYDRQHKSKSFVSGTTKTHNKTNSTQISNTFKVSKPSTDASSKVRPEVDKLAQTDNK